VKAVGTVNGTYLGYISSDSRARVAAASPWSLNPSQYYNGTGGAVLSGSLNGDNAIAITFSLGVVAAGATTTFEYYTIANASDESETSTQCLTANISGTQTVSAGEIANLTLSFTGTAPWDYTLSNGISGTATSSPVTIPIVASSTETYTITSATNIVSGICPAPVITGSATVYVCSPTQRATGVMTGSRTIREGQSANLTINFTGIAPYNYTYSDGTNTFTGTAASASKIISVTPASTKTYTLQAISSTTCGVGTASGNAVITVDCTPIVVLSGTATIERGNSTNLSITIDGRLPVSFNYSNGTTVFSGTATTTPFTFPVTPTTTTTYTLTSTSNSCGTGTQSGSAVVTVTCTPPTGVMSDNATIERGQSANIKVTFTGLPPFNYTYSDGSSSFSGTSSTAIVSIPVSPLTTKTYTLQSVSNVCGIGTSSGNAVITVFCVPATATLSGTTTIAKGSATNLSIALTGTGPWTYSYSNGTTNTSGTTTTSPVIISVSPLLTTNYTMVSVNNACGELGTSLGNAFITVEPWKLIACYEFNNNFDDSKSGNNGTVGAGTTPTFTNDRFGNPNSAAQFDGVDDFVQIPTTNITNNTYTFSAWVNLTNFPSTGLSTILSAGNTNADQSVYFTPSSQLVFARYNQGGSIGVSSVSGLSTIVNTWKHIVVTRSTTDIKIFIDGLLVSNQVNSGLISTYSTTPLAYIGRRVYGSTTVFKGILDNVKIYAGAMTDSEVAGLFTNTPTCSDTPCTYDRVTTKSLVTGNWEATSTWTCGNVPLITSNVYVNAGHTVTINNADAKAMNLLNRGSVIFANPAGKLTFGSGPLPAPDGTPTPPTPPTPIILTLQPGPTDGKDAEVSSLNPTTTNGSSSYFNLYDWTISGSENIKRVFIAFNLSTIPTNAVIDSAYLSLYFGQSYVDGGGFHTDHSGDNAFLINRITSPWTESTLKWIEQPTISTINPAVIPAFTSYRQHYPKMNVRNLVADMVLNPTTSFGFGLRHQVESVYKITLFTTSNDIVYPAFRPKLQVYYHLP
jgi:Concanavalin A-like lectin/glucanases superfamily